MQVCVLPTGMASTSEVALDFMRRFRFTMRDEKVLKDHIAAVGKKK